MASPDQKLTKLEQLLKMVDESLTREEFVNAFENVVNAVQQVKAQNEQDFQTMREKIDLLVNRLKSDNQDDIEVVKMELKTSMNAMMATMSAQCDAMMKAVHDKMATMRDGEDGADGQDANEGAIIEAVLERIPPPDLKGFKKALDDLKKDLELKIKNIPEKPGGLTVFGPGKTRVVEYDLSDQLNGVTKTFTLGTHFGILSVDGSSAPFGAFRRTTDYNEVGKTIVFTSSVDETVSLAQGQSLIVRVLR